MKPDTIPEEICGMITENNAFAGVAPRSRAASYKLLSICFNLGMIESTTNGVQSTICPTIKGINVDLGKLNATKRNAKEIAVTTSALITGIWLTPLNKLDVRFLQ